MFKIKYTGAEKVSIIIVSTFVALFIYSFIRFHTLLGNSLSYLPFEPQTVSLITNITADFFLLYILVLSFIKLRKYKQSDLTVFEKYIELTFDESVSIVLYNLDRVYMRLKHYIRQKLKEE